ncbi:hypothetical protein NP233_g7536 [Leucocoprinus birnbaumii]|uniref:Uncharacterized protein n=1 Tax=Leucocoprinus birnbaumii TaxID=56174 RepID=A0AAD5VP79_9AGAR|nr:hypothetical protein NP233_g7536 [Leucocoprinus birnbaumii]
MSDHESTPAKFYRKADMAPVVNPKEPVVAVEGTNGTEELIRRPSAKAGLNFESQTATCSAEPGPWKKRSALNDKINNTIASSAQNAEAGPSGSKEKDETATPISAELRTQIVRPKKANEDGQGSTTDIASAESRPAKKQRVSLLGKAPSAKATVASGPTGATAKARPSMKSLWRPRYTPQPPKHLPTPLDTAPQTPVPLSHLASLLKRPRPDEKASPSKKLARTPIAPIEGGGPSRASFSLLSSARKSDTKATSSKRPTPTMRHIPRTTARLTQQGAQEKSSVQAKPAKKRTLDEMSSDDSDIEILDGPVMKKSSTTPKPKSDSPSSTSSQNPPMESGGKLSVVDNVPCDPKPTFSPPTTSSYASTNVLEALCRLQTSHDSNDAKLTAGLERIGNAIEAQNKHLASLVTLVDTLVKNSDQSNIAQMALATRLGCKTEDFAAILHESPIDVDMTKKSQRQDGVDKGKGKEKDDDIRDKDDGEQDAGATAGLDNLAKGKGDWIEESHVTQGRTSEAVAKLGTLVSEESDGGNIPARFRKKERKSA